MLTNIHDLLTSLLLLGGCQIFFTTPQGRNLILNQTQNAVEINQERAVIVTNNDIILQEESRNKSTAIDIINSGKLQYGTFIDFTKDPSEIPKAFKSLMLGNKNSRWILLQALDDIICSAMITKDAMVDIPRVDRMFICKLAKDGESLGLLWKNKLVEFTVEIISSLSAFINQTLASGQPRTLAESNIFANKTNDYYKSIFRWMEYCPANCRISTTGLRTLIGWDQSPLCANEQVLRTTTRHQSKLNEVAVYYFLYLAISMTPLLVFVIYFLVEKYYFSNQQLPPPEDIPLQELPNHVPNHAPNHV